MNRKTLLVVAIAAALLRTSAALGWLRPNFEDATVVERSELIVVGHLVQDSVQYVAHSDARSGTATSWEHHGRLAVTEVVKGKCEQKELPIIIHYGLDPIIGGYKLTADGKQNTRPGQSDAPPDRIEILDTGNSVMGMAPPVEDAAKDNLWFLRRLSGTYGEKAGEGDYGIKDPEDLKPLAKKDYILAYLAPDPVVALRKYADEHPDVKNRVERYADHCEIQRILKIENPAARFDGLLPYYLKNAAWGNAAEARDGVIACGQVAGAKFLALFNDPKCESHRQDIVKIWARLGYREANPVAVPFLVGILKREDTYWATETLAPGWWNDTSNPELRNRRQSSYGDVYYTVCTLGELKDPASREALELTLKRWQPVKGEPNQIVGACEEALRNLPPADGVAAK